jgi:hypothetical protein
MKMRIYQGDAGEVMLGIDIPHGFIPVLVWPTWAEYAGFVESMNQFVEDTYRKTAMRQSLIEHINSITRIDALG